MIMDQHTIIMDKADQSIRNKWRRVKILLFLFIYYVSHALIYNDDGSDSDNDSASSYIHTQLFKRELEICVDRW